MTSFLTQPTDKSFVLHTGQKALVTHVHSAPPGALDVLFSQTNRSGATVTNPIITIGHPFAKGHVAAGEKLTLFKNDGVTVIPVQQDSESHWMDGSLKFASLSFVSPDTFTDAQKISYRLKNVVGSPDRTPGGNTLANLTATHNFKLSFSGGDCGADTYTVNVNNIVANNHLAPAFGINPLDGFEVCKQGSICCEWRFWSYLKRDSDNAYHSWIKANIWIRSWGVSGPYQITGLVTHPNCWGPHPSGTIGGAQPPKFAANIVLQDGSIPIYYWGGVNDPINTVVNTGDFDLANGWITLPVDSKLQNGQNVVVSGTGKPSGLVNNYSYNINYNADAGHNQLLTYRRYMDAGRKTFAPWQPSHVYSGDTVVSSAGGRYYTVNGGTSSTVPPTFVADNQAFVDGTVSWYALVPAMGTAGTGTANISPIPTVYLHCGVALATIDNNPVWVGSGSQPQMVPMFDMVYLYRTSKITPPFMTDIVGYQWTYSYPSLGYYYNLMIFGQDISSTGDNPGDERIGYLQHSTMNSLLSDDLDWDKNVRGLALCWTDYWLHYEDERCGWWPTTNNGPTATGTPYPNLATPAPFAFAYYDDFYANGLLTYTKDTRTDPGYDARYGNAAGETSHLPALWFGAYLRTGHDIYLYLGIDEAISIQLAMGNRTDIGVITPGRNYYGLVTKDGQTRGIAWGCKGFALAQHCCPSNHVMHNMMQDCMRDSADWLVAWPNYMRANYPASAECGWFNDNQVLWQQGMMCISFGVEAMKGEYNGWSTFMRTYFNAVYPNLFDDNIGGSSYHEGAHHTVIAGVDGSHPTVNTPAEIWQATYGVDWVDSPNNLAAGEPPFSPATDYQMGMVNFPWPTTDWHMINYAGIKMAGWCGVTNARQVCLKIEDRIAQAGGMFWSGHSAGSYSNDAAYPPFSIAIPP